MKNLYTQTAFECSKLITKTYSTSFSKGIQTLSKKYHEPIYAIYGFVRYADEIVDTFHEHDKKSLLARFKADTYKSIEEKISLNPVLHSFQEVVNKFKIDYELIDSFLTSMEMDLNAINYDDIKYKKYIYGSAEVVGLMCLKVFLDGNKKEYQKFLPAAKQLGSAFQKINFLRDIKSDYLERGRVYFPEINFHNFKEEEKKQIEQDIKNNFDHAFLGIKMLPKGARKGVYLTYLYYKALLKKITSLSSNQIISKRIRISNYKKFILFIKCYFLHKFDTLLK